MRVWLQMEELWEVIKYSCVIVCAWEFEWVKKQTIRVHLWNKSKFQTFEISWKLFNYLTFSCIIYIYIYILFWTQKQHFCPYIVLAFFFFFFGSWLVRSCFRLMFCRYHRYLNMKQVLVPSSVSCKSSFYLWCMFI